MTKERIPLILFSGRAPHSGEGGGAQSFCRALLKAAALGGFDGHAFASRETKEALSSDFCTEHLVDTGCDSAHFNAPAVGPLLSKAAVDFLLGLPRHHLASGVVIHAIGVWGETAVKTRDMLEAAGIKAVALISVWTVYSDEKWTQLLGAFREGSLPDFWFLSKLYLRARLLVRPVEARGMRAADLVLVNYNCIARDLRRSFGHGLRIRKISYATELAFGQPAPLLPAPNEHLPTGNAPLIVCLSRHDSRKGIDVLLRTLGILHRKGVPFRACITSAGPLLEHHRRLAAKLGILEQTTFPGWVADVRAYLQAAAIFVLPSRAEQSGSVAMLEAMQLERCVVASACDGIPEDAIHNHSALLAKPGNAMDLADQLETVLRDPALRARLAAAGRTVYEARFSAGAFTAELVTLYRELLATKEAPEGAN